MISYLISMNLQIPNFDFSPNQTSSLGCYFGERYSFFEIVIFLCFRPNPYTRMCVFSKDHFDVTCKKVTKHCKALVEFWFWGFSMILDFPVYFNRLSRITFWGWGTTSRFLGIRRNRYLSGQLGPGEASLYRSSGRCTY